MAFLFLITVPLLQAVGQVCEKNEESGINECAPHNMLYVIFWNLSNFFDHHEGTVIGVATIFLALITAFLWDATRDLVHGAERTAEKQLRAYLHVDKCVVAVTPDQSIRQYVSIRNFGQTPAYKCYYRIQFWVWNNLATVPDFESFDKMPATAVLAPEGFIEADLSFDIIKGQEAVNVLKGAADLYVWGVIFYTDAFGVDRQTNFRMKYHFRKNSEAGFFRPTNEGNEAT